MLTPPQLPAQPPTRNTLEQIIAAIPSPRCVPAVQTPFLVFLGSDPGINTSGLAREIAHALNTEYISPDSIFGAIMAPFTITEIERPPTEAEKFSKQIYGTLASGEALDTFLFLKWYEKLSLSEDAQFRGFVLDGLPFATNLQQSKFLIDKETEPSFSNDRKLIDNSNKNEYKHVDISLLAKILSTCRNAHSEHNSSRRRLVLVEMKILAKDLETQRIAQFVDPVTGLLYTGGQVEYSRRRRREGWTDGTADVENEAALVEEDRTWDFDFVGDGSKRNGVVKNIAGVVDSGEGEDKENGGAEDEDEEQETNEEIDEEDNGVEGEEKKKKKKGKDIELPLRFNLSNKSTWKILSQEVLDRLLKRPEDTPEIIRSEFDQFSVKKIEITKLKESFFDPLNIITLDATQHPDILLKSALNQLSSLGFSLIENVISAKRLEIQPGTFTGMTQNDIYTFLNAMELEWGEPQREESSWGRFCPVKFFKTGDLVHKGFELPVSYRGNFYFLSDEDSVIKFIANPNKFLENAPCLSGIRVCVLGGPFTGKTAQAKMLAKIYNLKYISVDDILEEWDQDPNQKELKTRNPMYKEIVKRCRSGQSIAPETMIELVKMALQDSYVPAINKNSKKTTSGWVIDGFPRTLDEARAMVVSEIIPEFVIFLTNDINDERVRVRMRNQLADSKSGKPWKAFAQQSTSRNTPIPHPPSSHPPTSAGRITTPFRNFKPSSREFRSSDSKKPTPVTYSKQNKLTTSLHPKGNPFASTLSQISNKEVPDLCQIPALSITMIPNFDNLFNGFKEELPEIIKLLENKAKIMEIAAEQAIPTILAVIQSSIDFFLPKATELSEKQIQELPSSFELGSTKEFCPFALRQANILQKGNPQIAVKYLGQIYYLSNEDAKLAFLMEPHNYVNVRELMAPPPPRFFFLGPKGSGKTSCIKNFETLGVPHIQFTDYVYQYAKTADMSVKEEIEYMMKENAGVLSPILAEVIMTSLFKIEPYASNGFLIEGFPRTKVEAEVVVKHNMYIDAVIVLRIDADVAVKRIVFEKKKDAKAKKIEAEETLKKNPLNPKAVANFALAQSNVKKYNESAVYGELLDVVEKENNRISDVVNTFENSWQVPLIEIDCNKCLRPIIGNLKKNLIPFFENRKSLLSNAMKIDFREAEMLMRLGIKTYSAFGKICPVTVKKNASVLKRPTGTKPALYRNHVYYFRSEEDREEFLANTFEYISQPAPQPVVRPHICILGRTKSGKTALAAKIAAQYDLVHLTIPIIINSIINGKEKINLAVQIENYLKNGKSLPEDVVVDAVLMVTSRAVCLARGFILDGYPQTMEQAKTLEQHGLIPHTVFELKLTEEEVNLRSEKDSKTNIRLKTPRLDFPKISQLRDETHQSNLLSLRALYHGKYENWIEIDGSKSKWYLKNEVRQHLETGVTRQQNYKDLKRKGLAAPIFDIGLGIQEIQNHLSKFGDYCPVSLFDKGELSKGLTGTNFTAEFNVTAFIFIIYIGSPFRISLSLEWQGQFYKMASKDELQVFLETPEKYAYGPDLPEFLPQRVSTSILVFPRQIELQGYCPVTLSDGPPGFESIVCGSMEILAEYENKVFSFETELKLDRFMRTPWKFVNLELPKKLPPKLVQINVGQLPLIGFLEQSIATALTDALMEVGKFRPKHPYTSLRLSAAKYVALYLKANNSNSKEWIPEDVVNSISSTLVDLETDLPLNKRRIEQLSLEVALLANPVKQEKSKRSEELQQETIMIE
ncbi:adenylate kinase [Physocladia obscura]|uniref:Adenylate kinase n=1 Tax=Physocladia obscura TaxID=109957 RepID=A0AAD5XK22_9FUNG|nr:adenylate kinase [Physocladia obscura]